VDVIDNLAHDEHDTHDARNTQAAEENVVRARGSEAHRLPNGRFPKGNGASSGESQGAGWGGPARGNGNGSERNTFNSEPGPGRGNMSAEGIARRERRELWRDDLRLLLYNLAHDGEPDAVKVAAARALLDRIEGLPVATVINADAGPIVPTAVLSPLGRRLPMEQWSDEELDLAIAAGEAVKRELQAQEHDNSAEIDESGEIPPQR
jgi:hypothetical protein